MITRDNKLWIFENFIIDYNLPKWKKDKKQHSNHAEPSDFEGMDIGDLSISTPTFSISEGRNTIDIKEISIEKITFFKKLFKKKPKIEKPEITIQEFFNLVKTKYNTIKIDNDLLDVYEKSLISAKENGQTALFEKLSKMKNVVINEAVLNQNGITKYILEDDIVEFYKKSKDKKLSLLWIKNFNRIIPSEITKLKIIADELKVFDNYVILAYDPNGDSFEDTEEEKRKKKDPILFGVFKDSNRLYYIGDWIDEFCDLTLEKFIQVNGKDAHTINNKSVNSYIK